MQLYDDTSPNINHLYFVEYVTKRSAREGFRVLDYGCGRGEIVSVLRARGVDACGCDVFYAGGTGMTPELTALIQAGVVKSVEETGPLPYDPQTFDLVIANQVFEHVRDLESTLARLKAVLRPGGRLCLHFPSKEVIREGHIGIPLAHWFRPGTPSRVRWTKLLRILGFGYRKDRRTIDEWTRESLGWIDEYTFYRPYSELRRTLEQGFEVRHNEIEYIQFRARRLGPLGRMFNPTVLHSFWQRLFRRFGFMVLELRPRSEPEFPVASVAGRGRC